MKINIVLLIFIVLGIFPSIVLSAPPDQCYVESFSDEFNGTDVDLYNETTQVGTWRTMYSWCSLASAPCPINNELQYYVHPVHDGIDPFEVSGGTLKIIADDTPYGGMSHTSGLLTSEKSHDQTYGYFEIRAKMPNTNGTAQGLWPAFWGLPTARTYWQWDAPDGLSYGRMPEVDIMEHIGDSGLQGVDTWYATLHTRTEIPGDTPTNDPSVNGWYIYGSDFSPVDLTLDFHTYGLEWTADTMKWYYDGQLVKEHNTPDDFTDTADGGLGPHGDNAKRYILLNLAVGGDWPGNPDGNTTFPAEYEIDYVRAYELDPNCGSDPDPDPEPISVYDTYIAQYETDIDVRNCTSGNYEIVNTVTALKTALNNAAVDTICVEPGTYDLGGNFTVTDSGTITVNKVLRYYSASPENILPWGMVSPVTITGGDITFSGNTYWTIWGIEFDGEDTTGAPILITNDSENLIFDNIWLYNSKEEGLKIDDGARYVWVQNSNIHDIKSTTSSEGHCIRLNSANTDSRDGGWHRFVNNSIWNCWGDGIQTWHADADGGSITKHIQGVVLENNDWYVTDSLYYDVFGNMNTGGPFSCSENGIDIKVSSTIAKEKWQVIHNRFHGFRSTAAAGDLEPVNCAVQEDFGFPIRVNLQSENVLIKNNILWDNSQGIWTDPQSSYTSVIDNVFHDSANSNKTTRLRAIFEHEGNNTEFYGNIIHISDRYFRFDSAFTDSDFRNNIFVNARDFSYANSGTGFQIGYGMYFGNNTEYGTGQIGYVGGNQIWASVDSSNTLQFCFDYKLQTTATLKCIDNIIVTTGTPYTSEFDTQAGNRLNIGINDFSWTWDQSWLVDFTPIDPVSDKLNYNDYVSPYYDSMEDRNCTASGSIIISTVAQFNANVNDSQYDTYCIEPGDYSTAGTNGIFEINHSGTVTIPKVIKYYVASGDLGVNPWEMSVNGMTTARIPKIDIDNQKYWQFDRLEIYSPDTAVVEQFKISGNDANNIILNRMWIHENKDDNVKIVQGADNITVQRSFLDAAGAGALSTQGSHNIGHLVSDAVSTSVGLKVIGNILRDATADGYQNSQFDRDTAGLSKSMQFLFDDNDIYQSGRWYNDGNANVLNPLGIFSCSENAIDVKNADVDFGTASSVGTSYILNNRMWGWRWTTDPNCFSNSRGFAVVMHHGARNIKMEGNVIFDSVGGLSMTKGDPQHVSINNNLWYYIGSVGNNNPTDLATYARLEHIDFNGNKLNEYYGNLFIKNPNKAEGEVAFDFGGENNGDIRNNVFMETTIQDQLNDTGWTIGHNAYYNSTAYTGTGSIGNNHVEAARASANMAEFCFTRRKLTLKDTYCIPDVIVTTSTPHVGQLYFTPGDELGKGIDDELVDTINVVFITGSDIPIVSAIRDLGALVVVQIGGEPVTVGTVLNYWVLDMTSLSSSPTASVKGSVEVQGGQLIPFVEVTNLNKAVNDDVYLVLEKVGEDIFGVYKVKVK